jgi:predicted nucleic acid-binding protein
MPKPLVLNSTPLIYLTRVSLTTLFTNLNEDKITTSKVYHEVVVQGKKKGSPEALLLEKLFKKKMLIIHEPTNKEFMKTLVEVAANLERQPLHEAEAEVLAVANEVKGVAIIDDKVARSVASLFGIETHGTGYVLGKMYSTGKMEKETLIQKVKEMRNQGWYISGEDYLDIIKHLEAL